MTEFSFWLNYPLIIIIIIVLLQQFPSVVQFLSSFHCIQESRQTLFPPSVRRAEATGAGGNRPLVCQRELKDPKRSGGPSSASRNLPWHLMGDVNWRCCFGVPQPGLKVHLSTAEAPGRRAPDPPASDPINRATLWLFVSHFHVNTARKVCV